MPGVGGSAAVAATASNFDPIDATNADGKSCATTGPMNPACDPAGLEWLSAGNSSVWFRQNFVPGEP